MLKIHLFIFKYREKIVTFAFSVTPVQKKRSDEKKKDINGKKHNI